MAHAEELRAISIGRTIDMAHTYTVRKHGKTLGIIETSERPGSSFYKVPTWRRLLLQDSRIFDLYFRVSFFFRLLVLIHVLFVHR